MGFGARQAMATGMTDKTLVLGESNMDAGLNPLGLTVVGQVGRLSLTAQIIHAVLHLFKLLPKDRDVGLVHEFL